MGVIASDRRTLVVGLGKTGLSVVRHLSAQGRAFAVADNRSSPPGLAELKAGWPDVPVYLGPFDAERFAQFNELVVSPGISIAEPAIAAAVASGARIRGDIDLFAEVADAPVVAITGSNGKTTVTTLVGEMARAAGRKVAVGGNIGTPALDLLGQGAELYVLELSSFQLETTDRLNALVATILNVSDDHMDRYPNKMAYFQAKQRIFRGARHAVVNLDDPLSTPMVRDGLAVHCYGFHRVNPETFSTRDDDQGTWITYGFDNLLLTRELKLMGQHNVSNVMAALALGRVAGLPMAAMLAAFVPGRPLGAVDTAHRQVLDAAGYGAHRYAACGYSLGATFRPSWMDVPPMIYAGNPLILEPGMVFFPHAMLGDSDSGLAFGLGDSVVVTETGFESLSQLPLDWILR